MPTLDRLEIDDPVGAIPVHLAGSIWGMIAVGLFVERDGILKLSKGHAGVFRRGGLYLLGIQVLTVIVVGVWSGVSTYVLLWVNARLIISAINSIKNYTCTSYNFSYTKPFPRKTAISR